LTAYAPDSDTRVTTLPNGVRVLTIALPALDTASVSIFVRSGSAHERKLENGISHVIEHMAFKGTAQRDAWHINLDAERLGADVNAHTDKDHTAYHMRGLARHAPLFVSMLGDIVRHATFPADELDRERQVILQEFTEDEDDPMSAAFKLFDAASWGTHPLAQPVIGSRRNIERFSRDDLVGFVARNYSGANVVVAAAGAVDHDAIVQAAQAQFADMPTGAPNTVAPVAWAGDVRSKRMAGSSQVHLVMGFPIPAMAADDPTPAVAAALLGEGMSSPLLHQLRERRGLVYHAAASADVVDGGGQFVIEASTSPDQLAECVAALADLVVAQCAAIDPVDLERAHHQLLVRRLRHREKPGRRLESAALDLLVHGRLRGRAELLARIAAVTGEQVRQAFITMRDAGPTLAVTGSVPRGWREQARTLLTSHGL
jgi:predicted Zn-dependent peptidase